MGFFDNINIVSLINIFKYNQWSP